MKKHFYQLSIIFVLIFFTFATVKASPVPVANNLAGPAKVITPPVINNTVIVTKNGQSTNLPIDNGILLLTIAGITMGIIAIKKQYSTN